MAKNREGSGASQIETGPQGAPDFARENPAPREVREEQARQTPNTLDPSRGGGKTKGDGAKE